MSFPDDEVSNLSQKPQAMDMNQAFFDFSQDFQQRYNSHQLLSFPDDKEENPFQQNLSNPAFPPRDLDFHASSNAFLFNGFECKGQSSRNLGSNIRLDCSPELKLGGKGSSRFFSFDPEDEGLNSFWGGKNHLSTAHFEDFNGGGPLPNEKDGITKKPEEYEKSLEHNFQDSDQKDANNNENLGGRSSRGLRVLSLKVKDIVCEKKETTYKEVADTLVQGLNLKEEEMGKDEQNVKRRVYDALNVLIAADVLKKRGKYVMSDHNSTLKGKSLVYQNKYEKASFEESKIKIRESIKTKTEKLRDIINKTVGLQYLIDRNKACPLKVEENREVLNFPFIAIENQSQEQVKCVSSKDKKDFAIFFKNNFGIFGDMDMLLKLGMHQNRAELTEKIVDSIQAKEFL